MSKKSHWMRRKKILKKLDKIVTVDLNHSEWCNVSRAMRKARRDGKDEHEAMFNSVCNCGCRVADYALLAAYDALRTAGKLRKAKRK